MPCNICLLMLIVKKKLFIVNIKERNATPSLDLLTLYSKLPLRELAQIAEIWIPITEFVFHKARTIRLWVAEISKTLKFWICIFFGIFQTKSELFIYQYIDRVQVLITKLYHHMAVAKNIPHDFPVIVRMLEHDVIIFSTNHVQDIYNYL